jgi:murein DD-endopeptidase MepM/ murein hydrolase activator NlpD
VEIDHGDGYTSLYAHFNAPPPVRVGQSVSQGSVIGYAGSTGYSTGVHLHFEIRRHGAPVDPLSLLP